MNRRLWMLPVLALAAAVLAAPAAQAAAGHDPCANHLERGQHGAEPIDDPCALVAPSDTGDDAHGFGAFEGQFGMLVLSKYPIDTQPRAHVPDVPLGGHAGCDAARRPGHARASRLVLAGGPGRAAAVVEVALGPARAHRPLDGPLHVSHPTRRTAAGSGAARAS